MSAVEPYKQPIEAIVHPINASLLRKNTMRRELWAHFFALAEEEGGNDAACARAWSRLGDPAELRASLQASITPRERLELAFRRRAAVRPGESRARFAVRVAPAYVALSTVASFLLMGIGVGTAVLWCNINPLTRAIEVTPLLIFFFAWLFCLFIAWQPLQDFVDRAQTNSNESRPTQALLMKSARAIPLAFLPFPAFFIAGYWSTGMLLGFTHAATVNFFYVWPVLAAQLWILCAITLLMGACGELHENRAIEDWPYA
ncbi:MAG: hypothetical protein HYV27_01715 [Candidatus Hydrogenedentes bacterium]|nr:hypothetical protein [Candidatus Hydrogenedentota bacterium]